MNRLIIIGASGHGKVVADLARNNGYRSIAFLDDNPPGSAVLGFPVLGKVDLFEKYQDSDYIVAIGDGAIRKAVQTRLNNAGAHIVTLVHPRAVVGQNVSIGDGSVVMAGAVINPDSILGEGCILNTCASVDHDCKIGSYSHIAVGAHIAGAVAVGSNCWIGAGATVINGASICSNCLLGAGAVAVKDIDTPGTYVGVPAKKLKVSA